MLVKRRLSIFSKTLEAYKVEWSVFLVSTTKNKADGLTHVPKYWLTIPSSSSICAIALHEKFPNNCGLAQQSHTLHHCGVETTLHFARKLDPSYTKSDAEFVVKNCRECQSIDPSALRINEGELSVEKDWKRLALDVTHHGCQKYLPIVDCGPSQFAIWRNIQNESESQVVSVLIQIFSRFGPPIEILCDNAKSFRSNLMQEFCKLRKISLTFRCGYKPSGNGIVERNHKTIKRMSARCEKSIDYCVFWYNITPHGSKGIIPSSKLISSEWRNPFLEVEVNCEIDDGQESDKRAYFVGDKVWVKPHGVRCTFL